MSTDVSPFLISIHPQYVRAILTGAKTVECRKSSIGLRPGDWLFLYATAPVKAILGTARVSTLYRGAPAVLWAEHQAKTCVQKEDFEEYYRTVDSAVLIGLEDVRIAPNPVSLSMLRDVQPKFSPPQTARRLGPAFAAVASTLATLPERR